MKSTKEKLDEVLKIALKNRELIADKKGEIGWLNYYIGELIKALEPLQRVSVGIKFNEFLSILDNIKTTKKAIQIKNKFIDSLLKGETK